MNLLILNNEKKILNFLLTEQDRGGFGVFQFFVKDNRFYTTTWNVTVPWSNKQLDITFETYRDKTLPGSEEKWKVKIRETKDKKLQQKCWQVCMMHRWINLKRIAGVH